MATPKKIKMPTGAAAQAVKNRAVKAGKTPTASGVAATLAKNEAKKKAAQAEKKAAVPKSTVPKSGGGGTIKKEVPKTLHKQLPSPPAPVKTPWPEKNVPKGVVAHPVKKKK